MMVSCDTPGIERAAGAVRDGGTIAYPTDTVYGLGCDPYNRDAVRSIYRIKGREGAKPMPVLGHSADELGSIADLSGYERVTSRFWPGPLTVIARITDARLGRSMGLGGKIAVRVPRSDCALRILERCGPLVGTSANISGTAPLTDAARCHERLGVTVCIDGGAIAHPSESTIIELADGCVRFIRQGGIPKEEVLGAL